MILEHKCCHKTGSTYTLGLPRQIDTGGKIHLVIEGEDEDEKAKISKYKKMGNIGLGMIAISFFIQLMSNIIH